MESRLRARGFVCSIIVFLLPLVISQTTPPAAQPVTIVGTVRDFQQSFVDMNLAKQVSDPYIPQAKYDNQGKPQLNASTTHQTVSSSSSYWQWYRSLPGINIPLPYSITLTPSGSTFSYSNTSFYPIDGKGWGGPAGPGGHNYFFTFELQTVFIYYGFESITLTTANDGWVFVNGQLILDLGGTHASKSLTVLLNQTNIGLQIGTAYSFDIYFAQRETQTGSVFSISTTAQLICPLTDWAGVCLGDGQAGCNCTGNLTACISPVCNVTTGACMNQTTQCAPAGSACQMSQCTAGTCQTVPNDCNDGNLCTTAICNISTGCEYQAIDCNDFNACTLDSCNTSIGCINTEINCDDGNPCTLDGCDYLAGCTHVLETCYNGNLCETGVCSGQSNLTNYPGFVNGSFVIAMDSVLQGTKGLFNLRAYGLATWLLWANVWMDWAILGGKAKDAVDFSALARPLIPTPGNITTYNFKGGPLVIHPKFASSVYQIASQFNAGYTPVIIYQLLENVPFPVQPRFRIQHKPYVAVLNSGQNWPIHAAYLDAAGFIRYVHYNITSRQIAEDVNASFCYTFASEPHFDSSVYQNTTLWPLNMMVFVRSGGNFLAECEGVGSYENGDGAYQQNSPLGGFMLTTLGINVVNSNGGTVQYYASDQTYMQFDGAMVPQGGSIPSWELTPNSYWINGASPAITYAGTNPLVYVAMTGHVYPARIGSYIHYLGGHSYATNSEGTANGVRMYLNAAIEPSMRAQYCPQLGICATSFCTPETITCSYVPKNCSDDTVCTIDSCNPFSGCVHKPVICDDNNLCTNDSCDPIQGCVFKNITCNDGDACTVDGCDPTAGCTFTNIDCNDHNPCTTDSCDSLLGCQYQNISCGPCSNVTCPSSTFCAPLICNVSNGICEFENVTCNDNNPCTTDSCVNGATGYRCSFVPVDCNDQDPCTYDYCNNGTCSHGNANCDDGDPCTIDSCVKYSATNGSCVHQNIICNSTSMCEPSFCNASGVCETHSIVCDDGNLCTTDMCVGNETNYACQFTPVQCNQTADACNPFKCNLTSGQCEVVPYVCESFSKCITDACTTLQGQAICVTTNVVCDDGDACTIDGCYSKSGCYSNSTIASVFCDDNNLCTVDTCNSTTGCEHTPVALPSVDACHKTYCDPYSGVLVVPNTCGEAGQCTCDPTAGCQCATPQSNTAVVVGASIGAGVVAAIIVAIVVFLIIGAIGGKKAYDALKKRAQKTDMVNSNPMYKDRGTAGSNPFFEHEK